MPIDRRLISGERLLCRCSLDLSNHDPFSIYRERHEGWIVMNVRGGSLYLPEALDEGRVRQVFPKGETATIKRFTLHPEAGGPIVVGDVRVRYLKTRTGPRLRGLVLRFVGLSGAQLDLLNALSTRFPVVVGEEENSVPIDVQRRPGDLSASVG